MNSGANHEPGTDMEILAPVVAEAYDLHLETAPFSILAETGKATMVFSQAAVTT